VINLNDYIGKPYVLGARGPDAFDCWGLVCAIYEAQLGVTLPDWHRKENTSDAKTITKFRDDSVSTGVVTEILKPEPFSIALLDRGKMAHHAGVFYLGGVIHCDNSIRGSRFDRLTDFGPARFFKWQT
jgi:cell wall-associated NlpC family hydrolase